MKATWTTEELREALLAYDKAQGRYPEHPYEGFAVWRWLCGESPQVRWTEATEATFEADEAELQRAEVAWGEALDKVVDATRK